MSDPRATDPRQLAPDGEADIRPSVALPSRGLPNWLIAIGVGALALLLFSVLEARRRASSIPAAEAGSGDAVRTATAAPPLYVPPTVEVVTPVAPVAVPRASPTPTPPPPPPPPPQIIYVPQPVAAPVRQVAEATRPASNDRSSALVFDASVADPATAGRTTTGGGTGDITVPGATATIARARRLANRATTVAQGTLIPAVLESALDSTRPGPARALVTRNVRGADGSRILIPRGSRLFGEYRADISPGQNRILITWTSLVRPDGAAVALASPSADPLGRVGVKGQVNSHFLARFGGALLQSALDLGVNLASSRVNQQVIVGLPGAVQTTGRGSLLGSGQVQPTITVRQGVSMSVFVARDLDFTGVQQR